MKSNGFVSERRAARWRFVALLMTSTCLAPSAGESSEVGLTAEKAYVDVLVGGERVRIERAPDRSHFLTGTFAVTARKCPPFCITPLQLEPGVTTVAELELFDFIEEKVNHGSGIMVDARTPAWHARGTIPGSISIPFTVLSLPQDAVELTAALEALGVRAADPAIGLNLGRAHTAMHWDFSSAKDVLVWCNGPWSDQSPRAVRALLRLGYPAEKVFWYRGGMQMWQILGLTTSVPEGPGLGLDW